MKTSKVNTSIGVKELKARASEIVGNVKRRRRPYTVTLRGQPVAILAPIDDPLVVTLSPTAPVDDAWDELARLGRKIGAKWPAGVSGVDALSDMRR
jgi:prevent-host-death family protein